MANNDNRKGVEKRPISNEDDEESASEKRIRLDKRRSLIEKTSWVRFDVIFEENLSIARDSSKNKPGSFSVAIYCQPDEPGKVTETFSFHNSIILNETLNVSTVRSSSHFNLHSNFAETSKLFVDVDLGFAVKAFRVEVVDSITFGRVSMVSAGLNCLGNHDHWSHGHWQPAWSRCLLPWELEGQVMMDNTAILSALIVPMKSQTFVSTFRFEMTFCENSMFFTDFTSTLCFKTSQFERGDSVVLSDMSKCSSTPNSPTKIPSFESLPERAVVEIVKSLHGAYRFRALLSLSGTCRRFRDILRHPSLYNTLDFMVVPPAYFTGALFNFVAERVTEAHHLRVAWMPHMPNGASFTKFLRRLSPTLRTFNAESCPFVDDKVLRVLSETQPQLETLDLTRCRAISPDAFRYLTNFTKLRCLSLQHTNIAGPLLCQLISSASSFEVLNISHLNSVDGRLAESPPDLPYSPVYHELVHSPTAPKLVALKINKISCDVLSLACLFRRCPNLEEVDCVQSQFIDDTFYAGLFTDIERSCPKLKRLSISELPKYHALKEDDMLTLLDELPDLEHLFVVPTKFSAEFLESIFHRTDNSLSLVIADRKTSPTEVDQLLQKFPNQRFTYIDFRQSSNESNDEDGEDEDGDEDDEDESTNSEYLEEDEDNGSFYDSGSEESHNELERFQEETGAQVTMLVSSVMDMTKNVDDIRTLIENLLSKRTFFMKRKALHANLRYSIACAMFYERYDVLAMFLDRCPKRDFDDVMAGDYPLLNFAIKTKNLRAIQMLLEKGTPTNPYDAMSAMGQAVTTIIDLYELPEDFDKAAEQYYLEVFKLLFDYKADPLFFNPEERGTGILHYAAYLAGRSPALADLLVENTPGTAYTMQEMFGSDIYEGPTPISSVLDMIDISDELPVAKNIFSHALLPLLRYGAPFRPDTCFNAMATMAEIVAADHHFSRRAWGQRHVLAQILIEARRHSKLDVAALMKITARRQQPNVFVDNNNQRHQQQNQQMEVQNDDGDESMASEGQDEVTNDSADDDGGLDGVSDEEIGDLILPFANFVRSQFPRPLQAQCRTVILNTLPMGPSRVKAVSDLDLPKTLTSFLNFDEFTLPQDGQFS